ncbi:MAG: FtsX-like permease family protein [Caldithrix sp.]|nr:FtsX-like permease family protein [Caldithrix sp.]
MYLSLSWRNIWRNKRRTLIAAASVFFAVILAALMRSGQEGSYSYMIHSSAKLFTGYLQVQHEDYWEKRSLNKSIVMKDSLVQAIQALPHVTSLSPRLESYALISHGSETRVSQVIGMQPEYEQAMTNLKDKLIAGRYLTSGSESALIGEGLADLLHVGLGDSIVLYGQGFQGLIAAAKLPIQGIIKMPFESMNNAMVYLALPNAQDIFATYDRITSLPIMVDNIRHLATVDQQIASMTHHKYALKSWDEMLPELKQNIQVDNASGIIMLIILYIVIAFGVFGTVMMMISERAREFGILISVGMRKWRLMVVTTIETILVAFTGVISGVIASIPIIYYFHHHPIHFTGEATHTFEQLNIEPIFNFSMNPSIFWDQAFIVLIIALATAVYPLLFIRRLKPIDAVRG